MVGGKSARGFARRPGQVRHAWDIAPFTAVTGVESPREICMVAPEQTVRIEIDLTNWEAWALATLCNRLRIRHCTELGAKGDDQMLAMYEAIQHIAQALRARGCYPYTRTNALDNGADIAKVQEWLGHAVISTTRMYDRRKSRAVCLAK
jgi:hypothetical protein